jgi:amino acid transporter
VILMVVIFVKLIGGSRRHGQGSRGHLQGAAAAPRSTPSATAAVFGFLSFAGFEGAASLGEETEQPARNIPRAIPPRCSPPAASTSSASSPRRSGFGTDAPA